MTIQKADPATRKRALYLIGAMTIVGAAAIHWGLPALQKYLFSLPPKVSLKMTCLIIFITFVPVSLMGFYFFFLGRKTLNTKQFPPRGTKVIKDTALLTGSAATRRGKMLILGGILLILLSVVGAGYFPLGIYRSFSRHLPTSSNPTSGASGLR
jgi:hypothetical protein